MRRFFTDKSAISWQVILLVALVSLVMVHPSESSAETLFGHIVSCTDGDTCTLLDRSKVQHEIRLFAIDAPETSCHSRDASKDDYCSEKSQPFGKASKRSISELVFGKEVIVELQLGDSYGREIGTIWADNINANLEQVRRGYAWMYRKYARQGMSAEEFSEMETAEKDAQDHHRGLWSDIEPTPPWEFRHRH